MARNSKTKRSTRSTRRPDSSRRAIVLLVVLSLLVLFVIVGLTFALVSSVYRKSATEAANNADREDDLTDELDRGMYMLLRDSERTTFVEHNSVFEDLYGDRPLISAINAATPPYNSVNAALGAELLVVDLLQSAASINTDKLSGCVLTVTSGPAANRSFRIVNSVSSGTTSVPQNRLRLLLAPADRRGDYVREWSANSFVTDSYMPTPGDRVVVSRRPYSGMGMGFVRPDLTTSPRLPPTMTDVGRRDPTAGPGPYVSYTGSSDPIPSPVMNYLQNQADNAAMGPGYGGTSNADVEPLRGVAPYMALLPHTGAYLPGEHKSVFAGLNEDWDAPDFQNMYLGWVPPTATAPDEILPSFHRPALVRYWFHWCRANIFVPAGITSLDEQWSVFNNTTDTSLVDTATAPPAMREAVLQLKRRIIFRPLAEDHPFFAANQIGFTLAGYGAGVFPGVAGLPNRDVSRYRWDVDNTGDGVRDSIWIDPLFPVKRTRDGRLYKTLIAPLIIDLDSRINVNAVDTNQLPQFVGAPFSNITFPSAPATELRRGQGIGPAEIDLSGIFDTTTAAGASFRNQILAGRYQGTGVAGKMGDDLLSYLDHRGLPRVFIHPGSNYRSVPDLNGVRRVAIDRGGHPVVDAYTNYTNSREGVNDTYETPLLSPSEHNSIFQPYDLEGVLRARDYDEATQSKRLDLTFLDTTVSPSVVRRMNDTQRASLTTNSNEVPIPAAAASLNLLDGTNVDPVHPNGSYTTIADLLRNKLASTGFSGMPIDEQIRTMLGPELLRGEPLDLNRPFGNARDDHPNPDATGTYVPGAWVADDILEWAATLGLPWGSGVGRAIPNPDTNVNDWARLSAAYGSAMDLDNDDPVSNRNRNGTANAVFPVNPPIAGVRPPNTPQQIYARHIFCLSLLLMDDFNIPFDSISGRPAGTGSLGAQFNKSTNYTQPMERELTVQRLAQWAVNVADFRDADAGMTVFEYDANPWNGWNVDGIPGTRDINSVGAPHPDRRLVIGLESPELLLTEAKAFHDVRTRDTDQDETGQATTDPAPNDDDDDDQFRIPQGSLFFELLCRRSPTTVVDSSVNPPVVPGASAVRSELPPPELYEKTNNGWMLDVGRMSPPRNITSSGSAVPTRYPVWRIAISEHHEGAARGSYPRASDQNNSKETRLRDDYFAEAPLANYGVERRGTGYIDSRPGVVRFAEIPFERFVWFTPGLDPQQPQYNPEVRQGTFANLRGVNVNHNPGAGAASFNLSPGQYMVVAPRTMTSVGAVTVDSAAMPSPESPSLQQLGIDASSGLPLFYSTNLAGVNTGPVGVTVPSSPGPGRVNTAPALALVAERERVTDPTGQPWDNLASKFSGLNITEPLATAANLERVPQPNPTNDPILFPPDAYMDVHNSVASTVQTDTPFHEPGSPAGYCPLEEYNMNNLQTYQDVRTAHLQRLANPLLPWNPIPLIDGDPRYDASLPVNPYVTVDWISVDCSIYSGESHEGSLNYRFASGQKGVAPTRSSMLAPWYPQTFPHAMAWGESGVPASVTRPPFFRFNLRHTLGFLNYWNLPVDGDSDLSAHGGAARQALAPGNYVGAPTANVFPWIKINNRDYASAFEIVQVPASSPARLGMEFSVRSGLAVMNQWNPPVQNLDLHLHPFSHLMNFHLGGDTVENWRGITPPPVAPKSSDLFRIFDFVHTPSRYVHSKRWPTSPPDMSGGTPNPAPTSVYPIGLKPPYNRLLEFRDPGKVNLNTMHVTHGTAGAPQSHIWNAIMQRFPEWRNTNKLQEVLNSRQGYGTTSGFFHNGSPYLPTRFANPYRSAMAAAHMPPLDYGGGIRLPRPEVEVSMFRPSPANPQQPLFRGGTPTTRDPARHAAFNYEGLQRLDNLTTHRSSCFAIWLTTGYFEVEPHNIGGTVVVDPGHQDGYRIMRELGTDTGEIKRQRAFYIIDRSIPVGFERGKNHNIDDAVLLRRIIE